MPILAVLTFLVSYLIGAIPFGYLIARWHGIDILREGSGNIGATNVGRVLGRRFGILVFFLDFAKGAAPAAGALGLAACTDVDSTLGKDTLPVLAGLGAFLGHLFPVTLRFRGGKGVATGAGVIAVLLPGPALGALCTWVLVVCASRYVSLASLAASLALCLFRLVLAHEPLAPEARTRTLFCFVAGLLVFVRHRANIVRLARGTETRIQDVPALALLTRTLHVLAVGLWFGSTVFFSLVVAPVVFHHFQSLGESHAGGAPPGFSISDRFDREQGTRLAGEALGPIFPWYYLIQGICGLIATISALAWSWSRPASRLHKVRSYLALFALLTVVIGWPIAQKLAGLRPLRFSPEPVVAVAASAEFAAWHLQSMFVNLLTLVLVTILTALTARLPMPAPLTTNGKAGVTMPP